MELHVLFGLRADESTVEPIAICDYATVYENPIWQCEEYERQAKTKVFTRLEWVVITLDHDATRRVRHKLAGTERVSGQVVP